MFPLQIHPLSPNLFPTYKIMCGYIFDPIQNPCLDIVFQISGEHPTFNKKDGKEQTHHGNWGLWEFNVFEVFLKPNFTQSNRNKQNSKYQPYFEYELGFNQEYLCLNFHSYREGGSSPLDCPIISSSKNSLASNIFQYKMSIKLPQFEMKVDSWSGNFYSILGQGGDRTYWGQNLERNKLDFHLASQFLPLHLNNK